MVVHGRSPRLQRCSGVRILYFQTVASETTYGGSILGSRYGSMAGFGPSSRPMNRLLYPGGFRNAWSGGHFVRVLAEKDTKLDLFAYRCPADNGPPRGGHCADWIENPELS